MSAKVIDDKALIVFGEEIGADDPVTIVGGRTQWAVGGPPSDEAREVLAPGGIIAVTPGDMTIHVRAGTTIAELDSALAAVGQRTALPDAAVAPAATVGGAIAVGRSGVSRLGRGHIRDAVLQVRYVAADGRLVTAGGPTVKNVSGFDLCRLIVGSLGTLACVGDAILRTQPLPEVEQWYRLNGADPQELLDALPTAASILWDGTTSWIQLSGYRVDVEDDLARLPAATESETPACPPHRWSRRPGELRRLGDETGGFMAEIGVGVVHCERPEPEPEPMPAGVKKLHRRVRDAFDPDRRLNPGRSVEMM